MLEPLAPLLPGGGLRQGSVHPNTRLLILGAGTIGLMHLLTAHAWGVKDITITDRIATSIFQGNLSRF